VSTRPKEKRHQPITRRNLGPEVWSPAERQLPTVGIIGRWQGVRLLHTRSSLAGASTRSWKVGTTPLGDVCLASRYRICLVREHHRGPSTTAALGC
jgi:hypothetical protein